MELGIAGKVALVTASSKGLGRASALALAGEGVNVIINSRGSADLEATATEIKRLGVNAIAIEGDVTEPGTPQRLVDAALEHFGSIDILVANAGGPAPVRALDVDDRQILDAVNANMLTSIRLVQAVVPSMKKAGWGRICLITSKTIKEPMPSNALSNAARTGLWAWAKTAAQDLFDHGITLNTICPGNQATDRLKELPDISGPFGNPEDFGKATAFLCSAPAAFITGTSLVVDGGSIRGL